MLLRFVATAGLADGHGQDGHGDAMKGTVARTAVVATARMAWCSGQDGCCSHGQDGLVAIDGDGLW